MEDTISTETIRLILEDGSQAGFVTLEEAQERASSEGLDLVEVAPGVHKILNQGRLVYAANKARKASKQRQQKTKEVQFRLNIGKSDYDVKIDRIAGFINDGDKVRVLVQLKGREIARGEEVIRELLDRIADSTRTATVDGNANVSEPSISGRTATMILEPHREKKS